MLIARTATDSSPYIYLFFSMSIKSQNDAAIEEADGVSFWTDGRYKPVNYTDQIKLKISANFMQI